jgi:hypothetical protein
MARRVVIMVNSRSDNPRGNPSCCDLTDASNPRASKPDGMRPSGTYAADDVTIRDACRTDA